MKQGDRVRYVPHGDLATVEGVVDLGYTSQGTRVLFVDLVSDDGIQYTALQEDLELL